MMHLRSVRLCVKCILPQLASCVIQPKRLYMLGYTQSSYQTGREFENLRSFIFNLKLTLYKKTLFVNHELHEVVGYCVALLMQQTEDNCCSAESVLSLFCQLLLALTVNLTVIESKVPLGCGASSLFCVTWLSNFDHLHYS